MRSTARSFTASWPCSSAAAISFSGTPWDARNSRSVTRTALSSERPQLRGAGDLGQQHLAPEIAGRPVGIEARSRERHSLDAGMGLQLPEQSRAFAVPTHGEREMPKMGGRLVHIDGLPYPLVGQQCQHRQTTLDLAD